MAGRLKVLISAYACEPQKGSEPGVGWNLALHMARYHDIWLLTRANNRPVIEAEIGRNPVPGLHFIYFDLPRWARFWKRGQRGVQFYYYLWQIGAHLAARKVNREVAFDLVHHVTFVKYWAPSFLSLLGVPFVWGPVGGGESAPLKFCPSFGRRGLVYEFFRTVARWLGEHDPFVRLTARRSQLALATTEETAARLRRIGARDVKVLSQVALSQEEASALGMLPVPENSTVRFVSLGRLIHWKGFHLGITAFARSGLPDAEYWIIGDGPERGRLQRLAERLGVWNRVHLWGRLPRAEALEKLAACHVLVHPSLHDSGGWVCLEAMAAGKPVICLDLGGPALQVTDATGAKVPAENPEQAVAGLAAAMRRLAIDPGLRESMGEAARKRVRAEFDWTVKAETLAEVYSELHGLAGPRPAHKSTVKPFGIRLDTDRRAR